MSPADRNHGASPLLDRSSDIAAAAAAPSLAAMVEIPPTRASSVKPYNDGDHDATSGRVLLPAESQPQYTDTIRYKTARG